MQGKTGSTFYSTSPSSQHTPTTLQSHLLSFQDKTMLRELESEIELLSLNAERSNRSINRITSTAQIRDLVVDLNQLMLQAKEKKITQRNSIQVLYEGKTKEIEKLFNEVCQQLKSMVGNAEGQMEGMLAEVRGRVKQIYADVGRVGKEWKGRISKRLEQHGKDMQEQMKEEEESKREIMGEIWKMERKIGEMVQEEEEKRKEMDSILYKYLKETCEKGEKSIRRKIY